MPVTGDDAVSEGSSSCGDAHAASTASRLAALLDRDPRVWRAALDERYGVLDDVLAGRHPAVVYPAARMGRQAAARLTAMGARVVALGDRDPALHGGRIDGLPVLSPVDIAAVHAGDAILVASTMFDSAICEDLRARSCEAVVPVGYLNLRLPEIFTAREYEGAWVAAADSANRAAIEEAYALLGDEESRRVFAGKLAFYVSLDKERLDEIRSAATIYFDSSVYELGADEVVVDGGAYVGDTLKSFLECCSGRFRSYFAFEPDRASYARLAAVAATDPARITAVRAGLARHTSSARLLSTRGADSRVLGDDEPGGESVPVVGLDEYFEGRRAPSLIKMDIEGAEAEALLGGARLLAEAAPALAVSAYHFPTDLWTVPLLIKRLMPRSRMYLRHYSREIDDTVCYALPLC
jgi:FkbM family methyltransferase